MDPLLFEQPQQGSFSYKLHGCGQLQAGPATGCMQDFVGE